MIRTSIEVMEYYQKKCWDYWHTVIMNKHA